MRVRLEYGECGGVGLGKFIHVDRKRVQSAMRRHDELLKDDERAQEELRRAEEEAERVKRKRDAEYQDERRDDEEGF